MTLVNEIVATHLTQAIQKSGRRGKGGKATSFKTPSYITNWELGNSIALGEGKYK